MNQISINEPATKKDLQELEEHLEKRLEDRFEKKFATKKDLQELEERLEKRFEKKFATKADLNHVKRALWDQSLRVEKKVDMLEEKLIAMNENLTGKLDKLAVVMDGFVGRVDDLTTDNIVGTKHARELQEKVDDHELRLSRIETSHQTA